MMPLPSDARILTPTGIKRVDKIKGSIRAFSFNGEIVNLHAPEYLGTKDVYKISFSDGLSCQTCIDQIIRTKTTKERNQFIRNELGEEIPIDYTEKSVADIKHSLFVRENRLNHTVQLPQPLEFPEKQHFITPYCFGVFFAKGYFKDGVFLKGEDQQILDRMREELPAGLIIRPEGKHFKIVRSVNWEKNLFYHEVERIGRVAQAGHLRAIPYEYLYDSIENRLELLRGLMDCRGYPGKTTRFATISYQLADDVAFLVRSLGGIATLVKNKNWRTENGIRIESRLVWTVLIKFDKINPFYIEKKASKMIFPTRYLTNRFITDVRLEGQKWCFALNSRSTGGFLTDSLIVMG